MESHNLKTKRNMVSSCYCLNLCFLTSLSDAAMKKYFILLLAVLCFVPWLKAQDNPYAEEDLYEDDPYFWSHTKEVGVNFTPLISKFVPFNLGQNDAGRIGFIYKKYYSTRAFRFTLGGKLNEVFQSDGSNFLYIGLGLEKRYPISKDKKLSYTSGWDVFILGTETGEEDALGVKKTYGFEYHFSKRVFISTEAHLTLGVNPDEGGPAISFQLPTAIFVNIRLY